MAQQRQIRTIKIQIDAQGKKNLEEIRKGVEGVNRGVRDLKKEATAIRGMFVGGFAGIFAGFGVSNLTQFADSLQLIRDRISILAGSTEEGLIVLSNLQKAATRTKTSVESLGNIYARVAASSENLGVSQATILQVVEALQNSFRLSGATAAEALATSVQLTQGFASGQLRGQELRSVLEQNVVLAKLLANELAGGDRGQLYRLAEKGLIDAQKVFGVILRNSGQLSKDAEKLGITFQQSWVIALDAVAVKIDAINQRFGLSQKFFDAIMAALKNLDFILTGIAAILAPKIFSYFKSLLQVVTSLSPQFRLISVATAAIGTTLSVIGRATSTTVENAQDYYDLSQRLVGLKEKEAKLQKEIDKIMQRPNPESVINKKALAELNSSLSNVRGQIEEVQKSLSGAVKITKITDPVALEKAKGDLATLKNEIEELSKKLEKAPDKKVFFGLFGKSERQDIEAEIAFRKAKISELEKAISQAKIAPPKRGKPPEAGPFFDLNQAFEQGLLSLEEYAQRLQELEASIARSDYLSGKKSIFDFRKQFRDFQLVELTAQFNKGEIDIYKFSKAIEEIKLEELNDKLIQNKISAMEFRKEVVALSNEFLPGSALQVGIDNYIEKVGTTSKNLADAITGVFSTLEDAIFNASKGAEDAWKNAAQAILDELTRVFIRTQIVANLARALSGFGVGLDSFWSSLTAGFQSGTGGMSPASGRGFGSTLMPAFASGGVVSGATAFQFGKNWGVVGEAGPEAILPLRRTPSGELGVSASGSSSNVVVNVINNSSGTEVVQNERKMPDGSISIDVLIQNKVREGIASGAFDRQLSSAFGLRRKGV